MTPVASAANRILVLVLAASMLAGCEPPPVQFLETKRIDERLSEREIGSLLTVLEAMGEEERSLLPWPFRPSPNWSPERTLPVSELSSAELDALERAWSARHAADRLPKAARLKSVLAEQHLTPEQFCALVLTVTAAIARAKADPTLPLEQLARNGTREIESLALDERPFSSLTPVERHATLRSAAWITITDRASKLAQVPPENVQLVTGEEARLAKSLPANFFADPFANLYPRPEDYGIPFEEDDISDVDLTWSPAAAIIGTDKPDE